MAWLKQSGQEILGAVQVTLASKPITWLGTVRPASFVLRRVAHEAAIHRWDAQAATGHPDGFEAEFATDGVDEVLELWVPVLFDYAGFGQSARIHLHATDDEVGWLIEVDEDCTAWRHAHEDAEVTARGDLADLYLAAWGRGDLEGLQVEGDVDCLARWQASASVGVDKVVRRYFS